MKMVILVYIYIIRNKVMDLSYKINPWLAIGKNYYYINSLLENK